MSYESEINNKTNINSTDTEDNNVNQQVRGTTIEKSMRKAQKIVYLIILAFIVIIILAFSINNYLKSSIHDSKLSDEESMNKSTNPYSEKINNPFLNMDYDRLHKKDDKPVGPISTDKGPTVVQKNNENAESTNSEKSSTPFVDIVALSRSKRGIEIESQNSTSSNSETQEKATDPSKITASYDTNGIGGSDSNVMNNTYQSANISGDENPYMAKISRLNPDLILPKGSLIQCSLRNAVITNVPGSMSCTISNDIFSESGNVLLIEKGSVAFGSFSETKLKDGDSRIGVIWSEIRTPNKVKITLNTGASSTLGESGIGGYVDNHFWERFGSAIMVSFISDVSKSLASRLEKTRDGGQNNFNFADTSRAGNDITKSILEKTVNIPPTIYRKQGDLVGIFLNNDIDFSDVYSLSKRN